MRCSVLDINETVEERRKRAFRWFHFNQGSLSQNEIMRFLADTTAARIPVLFISIPITRAGKEGLPSPPDESVKTIWKIPKPIADSSYCDFVHMNEKGREIYSNWLATLISREIKSRSSYE